MKLNPYAAALSLAAVCGSWLLIMGSIHLRNPAFGNEFLSMFSGLHPGFHMDRTLGDLLVGIGYAMMDGAVVGLLFAWLYNRVLSHQAKE